MQLVFGNINAHVSLQGLSEDNMNFSLTSLGGVNLCNRGEVGFSVNYDGKSLCIMNDIIGGYHIYYWQIGKEVNISDDIYEVLVATGDFPINSHEKRYFDRHGYGLADRTFREGLFRLPPSSTLIVNEKGLRVESNWPLGEIDRTPDVRKYKEAVQQAVDDSLSQLLNSKKKIVLCFSGGKDSLYLAKRMQDLGIDFDLVYWTISEEAQQTAERGAKLLGKNLIIMDVSDCNKELQSVIENEMYFDHHYSRIHYVGCQAIVKRYGHEVILVNGQNSDSILTYGPSETKRTSYWKRYLMYGNSYIRKWIYKTIIELGFRRRFVIPQSYEDLNRSLLDNFKYCMILDKNEPTEYREYLNECIRKITQRTKFSNQNNLWMYIKTFTHIYGSDCQVVTNSARHFELDLLLPFSTEAFMRAALTFKDDQIELRHPKYALR